MEILIVSIFILMVLVGGLQVFNRFVLNQSLSWSEEFQKFAHIWIVFLTIPIGYIRHSHIGMEAIVQKLPKKIQVVLEFFIDLLWLFFAFVLTRYTLTIMSVAKTQRSPGLDLRMDWVYAVFVVSGAVLFIFAARKLYSRIRGY